MMFLPGNPASPARFCQCAGRGAARPKPLETLGAAAPYVLGMPLRKILLFKRFVIEMWELTRVRWIATTTEEKDDLLLSKKCCVLRVRPPGEGTGTKAGAGAASEAR